MSSSVVWKNSLPPASRWPVLASGMPALGSSCRLVLEGGQRVEFAADLAGVARHLAHALLVVVELLQRDHRQEDVVLLEAEQRHRVVHQHVGVEHEQLGRAGAARRARARLGPGGDAGAAGTVGLGLAATGAAAGGLARASGRRRGRAPGGRTAVRLEHRAWGRASPAFGSLGWRRPATRSRRGRAGRLSWRRLGQGHGGDRGDSERQKAARQAVRLSCRGVVHRLSEAIMGPLPPGSAVGAAGRVDVRPPSSGP
jgi:hypothetical protein